MVKTEGGKLKLLDLWTTTAEMVLVVDIVTGSVLLEDDMKYRDKAVECSDCKLKASTRKTVQGQTKKHFKSFPNDFLFLFC